MRCGPGLQPSDDGLSCEYCPDGFFKSSTGKDLCKPCPDTNGVEGSTLEDGAVEKSQCASK